MKIMLSPEVYSEVMYLVNKCDKEISGLGKVKIVGDKVYVVKQYLLEQEVTGTTTDIDENAVSKLLYEAYKDGGLAEGELLWWWHSHVDMGVFWSGTDHATIKEFGKNGRIFATVFNKKREMRSAYYQAGTEQYPQMFIDSIETEIDMRLPDSRTKELEQEFEAKVKSKVWRGRFRGVDDNILPQTEVFKKRKGKNKKNKTKGNKAFNSLLGGKEIPADDGFFWDDDIPAQGKAKDTNDDELWEDYFSHIGEYTWP